MPTKVDISSAVRSIDALTAAAPDMARAALAEVIGAYVDGVMIHAPQDTRRYMRGWVDAANKTGLVSRPLPELRPSRGRDRALVALAEQVELWSREAQKWASFRERNEAQSANPGLRLDGKPRAKRTATPYHRVILRREAAARKRLEKAQRELAALAGSETALFFDAGFFSSPYGPASAFSTPGAGVKRAGFGRGRRGSGVAQRLLSTVRATVYGGEGAVVEAGGRLVASMRNLEPHSRIIEWRAGVTARARARARLAGGAQAGAAVRRAVRAALAA